MDRWLFWPTFTTLAAAAAAALIGRLPGSISFMVVFVVLPIYALAAIVVLAVSAFLLIRKSPRKAASCVAALVLPVLLWTPLLRATDYVHLGLTAWFGVGQLGPDRTPLGHGLEVFDWSFGFAGGPNTFLIRDESDAIALPPAAVTDIPYPSEFPQECAGRARHLLGHYYVCEID